MLFSTASPASVVHGLEYVKSLLCYYDLASF